MDLKIYKAYLENKIDFLKSQINKKEKNNLFRDHTHSDFVKVNDSTLAGYVVRSGPYVYKDGIKYKNGENLKETYENLDYVIGYGSKGADSHIEADNRFIGYWDKFQFIPKGTPGVYHMVNNKPDIDEKYDRVHAYLHTQKNISELSDLEIFEDLPVSASYEDLGSGDQQIVGKVRHIGVSLNRNELDRCSTAGGTPCRISLRKDLLTNQGVLRADFSQPPNNYNKDNKTMGKKKDKEQKENMDNSYDEDDEKEMSNRKKKMKDREEPDDKKSDMKDEKVKLDTVKTLISEAISEATKDMTEELEFYKNERKQRETKERADLIEELQKNPFSFTEDFLKDLSIEQLRDKKATIQATKLYKDFAESQKPSEQLRYDQINTNLFDETRYKSLITDFAQQGKKLWNLYQEDEL